MQTLEQSAQWWEDLATVEERAEVNARRFGDTRSFYVRIKTYRDTAKSIRLEIETGKAHCSCHLKSDCPCEAWEL